MAGGQLWHTQTRLARRSNPLRHPGFAGSWDSDPASHVATRTYNGRIDEIVDPDMHQVPAVHVGTRSTAAPQWMQLGRIAGRAEWRWVGAKCASVDELDPRLAALIRC